MKTKAEKGKPLFLGRFWEHKKWLLNFTLKMNISALLSAMLEISGNNTSHCLRVVTSKNKSTMISLQTMFITIYTAYWIQSSRGDQSIFLWSTQLNNHSNLHVRKPKQKVGATCLTGTVHRCLNLDQGNCPGFHSPPGTTSRISAWSPYLSPPTSH